MSRTHLDGRITRPFHHGRYSEFAQTVHSDARHALDPKRRSFSVVASHLIRRIVPLEARRTGGRFSSGLLPLFDGRDVTGCRC